MFQIYKVFELFWEFAYKVVLEKVNGYNFAFYVAADAVPLIHTRVSKKPVVVDPPLVSIEWVIEGFEGG